MNIIKYNRKNKVSAALLLAAAVLMSSCGKSGSADNETREKIQDTSAVTEAAADENHEETPAAESLMVPKENGDDDSSAKPSEGASEAGPNMIREQLIMEAEGIKVTAVSFCTDPDFDTILSLTLITENSSDKNIVLALDGNSVFANEHEVISMMYSSVSAGETKDTTVGIYLSALEETEISDINDIRSLRFRLKLLDADNEYSDLAVSDDIVISTSAD